MKVKMTNKRECPCCEGQGLIDHVLIKPLALGAYLCDECSAIWLREDAISEDSYLEFDPLMWEKGLQGDASEIEYLE